MNNELIIINEIKTKANKKQVYTSFDLFLEALYNEGVLFFGFTGVQVYDFTLTEDDINMANSKKVLDNQIKFLNDVLANVPLIEYTYFSIEKHKNGIPHIHGIIALRSLIGKNDKLELNLKTYLFQFYKDIQVDYLENKIDIFKFNNYVIKEHQYDKHYLSFFGDIHNQTIQGSFLDNLISSGIESFITIKQYNSRTKYIKGFGNDQFISKKNKIIYLWHVYLTENNITVCADKLFKRQENSKKTWIFFNKLEFLKNNYQEICTDLQNRFEFTLKNVDLYELMLSDLNNAYSQIKLTPNLLPNSKIDYNVIEFKDGLYFMNADYFFSFYRNKKKNLNLKAYKYFDLCYSNLKTPELWFSCSRKNKDFEDEDKLNVFCTNLGRYFHTASIENFKQNSLYLVGASNTGKTSLITNLLIEAKGIENTGTLSKSKEFAFENTDNKLIIICDEFKYNDNYREDLLKLLSNEIMSKNKKFLSTELTTTDAPVIFISNQIEQKMKNDTAFMNRLKIYTFDHIITNFDLEIKDKLKKELPAIMVFCNKLYFNQNHAKELKNRRKMTSEIKQYLA